MPFLRSQAFSPHIDGSKVKSPARPSSSKGTSYPVEVSPSKKAAYTTTLAPTVQSISNTKHYGKRAKKRVWSSDDVNVLIVLKMFGQIPNYRELADKWNTVCGANMSERALSSKWRSLKDNAEGWRIGWWKEVGRSDTVAMTILAQAGLDVEALCREIDVDVMEKNEYSSGGEDGGECC